jgi:hypothetical protein
LLQLLRDPARSIGIVAERIGYRELAQDALYNLRLIPERIDHPAGQGFEILIRNAALGCDRQVIADLEMDIMDGQRLFK